MKRGNVHQEEEEEEEEEFVSKKVPSTNNKDGKSNDKASATRSKHSVTEQRRRSKINERFQILRDLIPHSDQKRDTASFLLEVIEYVQYLQEKVQKYEGSSYQGWSPEPTKLIPWRNSHWRLQSFGGPPQSIKNDSGPGSTFAGCFGDNDVTVSHTMLANQQNDSLPVPIQSGGVLPHPLHRPNSDAQSTESPITSDAVNQQEELMVEGGTISIKSAYTQGLLNSLTQALQSAGVDLSQASVSVQIDLGKRANREPSYGTSIPKNPESSSGHQPIGHSRDASNGSELDQAQKRPKI